MKRLMILGLVLGMVVTGKAYTEEKKLSEAKSASGGEKGLVAYWDFNEGKGSKVNDVSGNKNDGTIVGTPKWAKAIDGTGLDFNGEDQYVDCGAEPKLNLTDAVTVEVWVYPRVNVYGDRGAIGNILYADGYKGGFGLMEWSISNTDDHYWYVLLANKEGKVLYTGNANNLITLDKWQFVVFTYDNNTLKLYIDGQLKSSVEGKGFLSMPAESNNLVVAKHPYSDLYFNGIIDEVKIYNRALTKDEIKEHYAQKSANIGK